MNTNYAAGWSYSAWVQLYLGEHQTALAQVRQWERLSPRDPALFQGKVTSAFAYLFLGQCEEAAYLAERIVAERPTFAQGWRILAISRALAGDLASASIATRKALELDPSLSVSALSSVMPLRRLVDVECLKEGYIRAGFPS